MEPVSVSELLRYVWGTENSYSPCSPEIRQNFSPPRFSSGFRLRNRCSETVAPTPVLGISPPAHTATAPGLCLQAKQGGRPISSPDLTPDSLLPRRAYSFSSRRRAFPSHNGRQDNRADI